MALARPVKDYNSNIDLVSQYKDKADDHFQAAEEAYLWGGRMKQLSKVAMVGLGLFETVQLIRKQTTLRDAAYTVGGLAILYGVNVAGRWAEDIGQSHQDQALEFLLLEQEAAGQQGLKVVE